MNEKKTQKEKLKEIAPRFEETIVPRQSPEGREGQWEEGGNGGPTGNKRTEIVAKKQTKKERSKDKRERARATLTFIKITPQTKTANKQQKKKKKKER